MTDELGVLVRQVVSLDPSSSFQTPFLMLQLALVFTVAFCFLLVTCIFICCLFVLGLGNLEQSTILDLSNLYLECQGNISPRLVFNDVIVSIRVQ